MNSLMLFLCVGYSVWVEVEEVIEKEPYKKLRDVRTVGAMYKIKRLMNYLHRWNV